MDIDFVMLWVDGGDPAWQAEKRKYSPDAGSDDSEVRYRDWDLLRYWFRGVEKYAPWVRKIHFVTWGHVPSWLDLDNPKLHFVKHEDYIAAEKLPLFNSSSLEVQLHKIEGLAEHFVYFNDDVFPLKPLRPELFFRNGLPCDMMAFQPVVANPTNPVMSYLFMNNSLILSRHFDKRTCVKKHPGHYFKLGYPLMYFVYNLLEMVFPLFTGFYSVHGPAPFLKSTFEEVWEKEGDALEAVSRSRFRSKDDVSQYLFREWQKLSGNFVPVNVHKYLGYYELSDENETILKAIAGQKKYFVCLNDTNPIDDFEAVQNSVQRAFEVHLGERSSFEK